VLPVPGDIPHHATVLPARTLDAVDIIAELNRRRGSGPTTRVEIIRLAVDRLFQKEQLRAIRKAENEAHKVS
jgi:hypothetical protein